MDQKRAGQALYLARCLEGGDANVLKAIERVYREIGQRDLDDVGNAGLVTALEGELVTKLALVQTAPEDEARLVLYTTNNPDMSNERKAYIDSQLVEIRGRARYVRVLRMRIGKERVRDVHAAAAAAAQASINGAASVAAVIGSQLFEFGYFPDIWAGHEELLPAGYSRVAFESV